MARASTRSTRIIAPGTGERISPVSFLRETFSELRKSVWPSREEVSRLTVIVLVLSVAAAFFLGGLDQFFQQTFNRFVL